MVFQWATGTRTNIDANVAGNVCKELENTVGLSARSLLDASRPKNAPLHDAFEWDNNVAAEKYREDQARYIIRHLVVVPTEVKKETHRAFFPIVTDDGESKQYENIETIIANPVKQNYLLDMAKKELQSFKKKYETLSELKPVIEAIDSVVDS